ncbi:MAG: FeoA domain-containing protein [Polyangiaceae bacterium]
MTLADARVGTTVTIERIAGNGSFRRRLLELGLLPGTPVTVVGIAPLRDPLELLVRGANLSIRRAEAIQVAVDEHSCADTSGKSAPRLQLLPNHWAGSTP